MTYPFLNLLLIFRLLLIRQQRGDPQAHTLPDQQISLFSCGSYKGIEGNGNGNGELGKITVMKE